MLLFRETDSTGTALAVTVTLQKAVFPPSAVEAIITIVPAETAVTLPLASTVATAVLLLVQLTALLVALSGLTVAMMVAVSPSARLRLVLSRVMDSTGTVVEETVTVQEAVLPPSFVVTTITAVPGATAVTLPLASTVATAVLLLVQVTVLSVASLGLTVAIKLPVPPTLNDIELSFN